MILLTQGTFLAVTVFLLSERVVSPFSQIGYTASPCLTDRGRSSNNNIHRVIRNYIPTALSPHSAQKYDVTIKSNTALCMGIRSLFGLGKQNNDNSESEPENPSDVKAALEAIKADLEEVRRKELAEMKKKKIKTINSAAIKNTIAQQQKPVVSTRPQVVSNRPQAVSTNPVIVPKPSPPPPLPTPIIPPPKPTIRSTHPMDQPQPRKVVVPASRTYAETTRDRVQRVKSGVMTEEEKFAYLTNALARQPQGTISAKKGSNTKDRTTGDGRMSSSRSKPAASRSSYRNDPLWNTVIGNTKAKDYGSDRGNLKFGDKVDNDSAKRRYLDMVTDPNRFASYAAMGGYKNPKPVEDNVDNLDEPEDEIVKERNIVNTGGFIDNLKSVLTNNDTKEESNKETYTDSLADRLQSAAIIKEQQDAEMKKERDLQRQKERERIAEAQKQAAEEIRKREEEKLKRLREEEARLRRAEEERREGEENRRKAMIAAQEEYWKKQMEKEREKKAAVVVSEEDKEKKSEEKTKSVAKKVAVDEIRSQQRDETEVLKKVSFHLNYQNHLFF